MKIRVRRFLVLLSWSEHCSNSSVNKSQLIERLRLSFDTKLLLNSDILKNTIIPFFPNVVLKFDRSELFEKKAQLAYMPKVIGRGRHDSPLLP